MDPARVCVFVDGQNCYRDARRGFHSESDFASCGQVWPRKLAELLVERGQGVADRQRVLDDVRVYCGIPSPDKQPTANAAHLRQVAAWRAENITVRRRPLRYPKTWPQEPAQEKGVDVALAVDLVYGAVRKNFDVAIVFSTDTDLIPALEAVNDLRRAWGEFRLEVAAWGPTKKRLTIPNFNIWCHKLTREDYEQVRDSTNYTLQTQS